ncbi:MAG: 3-oxoacid CoA-transferase subunit B [Baekduia sp.]
MSLSRTIAERAASHLKPGEIVNLGIGIPTLVADVLAADSGVALQTENGMLGVGPAPDEAHADPELVNAGKKPVTETLGTSYFSSAASFAMIRGGHVDAAVLGILEVDEQGRIANWSVPGKPILGVGGAMDLLEGARRVIVATTHTTKDGTPKIVHELGYPVTGRRPVDVVVTEAATFELHNGRLVLTEVANGYDEAWVAEHTSADYEVRT